MLGQIVLKEIFDHLKSLRFILMFLMITVLFIVSALLFIPDFHRQMEDFDQNRNQTLSQLSDKAGQMGGLFRVYSFNFDGPWVHKQPNYLSFISEGHESNLPNAFQPSAFKVYGPSKQVRSNILLWRSEALDWSFIIGITFLAARKMDFRFTFRMRSHNSSATFSTGVIAIGIPALL